MQSCISSQPVKSILKIVLQELVEFIINENQKNFILKTFFVYGMVQLRCNLTLALEQFTCTRMELLMSCALLPKRNSQDYF